MSEEEFARLQAEQQAEIEARKKKAEEEQAEIIAAKVAMMVLVKAGMT